MFRWQGLDLPIRGPGKILYYADPSNPSEKLKNMIFFNTSLLEVTESGRVEIHDRAVSVRKDNI